ncbi:uncharacterized protein LOC132190282 isoform X2 [Corylus avellana]|uniref:uncharacterized protein LOC132190282 isoform X2 n=1 Tax=Corylus avellana TaxID=13451 RepID=UPI00286C9AD4|nr:uncharacterized protein LOC132190282 isoform X2 [Corylus avellana]
MLCLPQLIHLHFISLPILKLAKHHHFFSTIQTLQHRHTAMASTPPKPSKQLGELLQDQQDPFILEAFLSERGCPKKGSSSKGNSKRFLKKSVSCCLNNSRKGFPARCTKILRAVYKKFVSIKDQDQREKISENRNEEEEESDRFSSASSTTVFVSCSESDKEEISTSLCKDHPFDALNLCDIREKEAATGRKLDASVLEEIPSHEVQQNARIRQEENSTAFPKKVSEHSLSSAASPGELLFHLAVEKPSRYGGVAELQGVGELLKSKRVLQQTKQLLFDCVREVVESHARKERGEQHCRKLLGPEELGKLICERITSWGKQAGDETNTNYLLDLDFLDSVEEWRAFEQQKKEIEFEIGDTILEEIKNEIVTEMFDFLAPTTC